MMSINPIEKAIETAKKEKYQKAVLLFEQDELYKLSPMASSYYALCLAQTGGSVERALKIAADAAKKEFYDPDAFFNLGKIYLLAEKKELAVKAFVKGLKFDNTHHGLLKEMNALGIRQRPSIAFLPRKSALNVMAGIVKSRLKGRKKKGLKKPS